LQESSDPPEVEDAMGGVGRGSGGLVAQNRRVAPSRRFGYVSVVHEGKFILFGGFDGTRWLNDMFVFDFETNKWTEVEPRGDLPSVRSCPAWAKDDRYVYVLGMCAQVLCVGEQEKNNALNFRHTHYFTCRRIRWHRTEE